MDHFNAEGVEIVQWPASSPVPNPIEKLSGLNMNALFAQVQWRYDDA